MVMVNVHVFDFLIHLSKFVFYDISLNTHLNFKKPIKPGLFLKNPSVFPKKNRWVGFFVKHPTLDVIHHLKGLETGSNRRFPDFFICGHELL